MYKQMNDIERLNFSITTLGAIISIVSIQSVVSICAGVVAIVSGIMAIRYYYIKSK